MTARENARTSLRQARQAAEASVDLVETTDALELEERIALYDDWRFITQERFDEIKKGMTKDEVREIAGVPYFQNIQVDEERGVETWLYKKREGGGAAIYFKTNNDKVYATNFEAIKTKVVE